MTTTAHNPALPLTTETLRVFLEFAADACNWSGTPLLGGNVASTRQTTAHLTHMKRAGLVTTFKQDGLYWLEFTTEGQQLAAAHGIQIYPGQGAQS